MVNKTPMNPVWQAVFFGIPLVLLVVLLLSPEIDPEWNAPVFHFYIVSYISLVSLVVASFVLLGVGTSGWRAVFVAMAFVGIAAMFTVHGISTPGVLVTGFNQAIGWSARLSLVIGAVFFSLSTLNIPPRPQLWVSKHRREIWLTLGIIYFLYIMAVYEFPESFARVAAIESTNALLALITTLLFIWGTWRAGRLTVTESGRLPAALSVALPWLGLAQVSQYIAPLWMASWWLYHFLMLMAFVVTMLALVLDYEELMNFKLMRYFVSLGVIIGIPLVALLSEAAVRLAGSEAIRWPMFGFSLLITAGIFMGLLLVVQRAQTILNQRTKALQDEKQWRIDFTNLLVHDLKTPLNVITVSLELMLGGKTGRLADDQRTRLERMRRGSNSILDLVNNLLEVERVEAEDLRLVAAETQLTPMLRESVDYLQELAEVYNVRFVTSIPDNLPTLKIDAILIGRVLHNLISNAVKFAPKNTDINITSISDSNHVIVRVTDSGPGIPVRDRQLIFEKFGQVHGAERTGVGLGLTFCKLAVEAHGGRIWVEDAPAQGSSFVFTLPNGS